MSVANYPTWEEFTTTSFAARHQWPLLAPETPSFMARDIAREPAGPRREPTWSIIGAPYVAASRRPTTPGVPMEDWIAAPKRVRQQSARYPSGYIQDFDLDVFEHLRMVDYGDADIPESVMDDQTPENVLAAQAAVETRVNDASARRRGGAGGDRAEQPLRELRNRQAPAQSTSTARSAA